MSNRYRVEVEMLLGELALYRLVDYCVLPGKLPKLVESFSNAGTAYKKAQELNAKDGEAKTAWDAKQPGGTPGSYGVDMAAPGAKDDTTVSLIARSGVFSMDVETHVKRYFIGANGLAVYGTHEAIDALRAKLNARYAKIQELSKINAQLRINLKDAQQAADKFKVAASESKANAVYSIQLMGEKLQEARKELAAVRSELDAARSQWGSDYTQVSKAATSRTLGISMADHVDRLEMRSRQLDQTYDSWQKEHDMRVAAETQLAEAVKEQPTAFNSYWKRQYDQSRADYEKLRQAVIAVASNIA